MNDGLIPFNCFTVRVLALCMSHRQGLLRLQVCQNKAMVGVISRGIYNCNKSKWEVDPAYWVHMGSANGWLVQDVKQLISLCCSARILWRHCLRWLTAATSCCESGWHTESTGVALQVPIEQVEPLPPSGTSKEWTTTIIGGAPVGTVPFLGPAFVQHATEMVCWLPRHRAMPLTATPGGNGGLDAGLGPQRGSGVCCSITGQNCIRNNHTTDGWTTRTHKPAVITGTKPSVKMVLTDSWFPWNRHNQSHHLNLHTLKHFYSSGQFCAQ